MFLQSTTESFQKSFNIEINWLENNDADFVRHNIITKIKHGYKNNDSCFVRHLTKFKHVEN